METNRPFIVINKERQLLVLITAFKFARVVVEKLMFLKVMLSVSHFQALQFMHYKEAILE